MGQTIRTARPTLVQNSKDVLAAKYMKNILTYFLGLVNSGGDEIHICKAFSCEITLIYGKGCLITLITGLKILWP